MTSARERPGPVRRALCRIGLHRSEPAMLDRGPCVTARWCPSCATMLWAHSAHEYRTHPEPPGHPCATVDACARCGDVRTLCHHRFTVRVPLAELPEERRPWIHAWQTQGPSPCHMAEFCEVCDVMSASAELVHDWDRSRWPEVACRRCREPWVEDGDD
jgi:hypothetical protein